MECERCGKDQTKQSLLSIVEDDGVFHSYCFSCTKEILRELQVMDTGFLSKSKIKSAVDVYNIYKEQELMNDPEKLKKILESSAYEKVFKDIKYTENET